MVNEYTPLAAVRDELEVKRDKLYRHIKRLGIKLLVGPDGRTRHMRNEDAVRLRTELQGFREPTPRKKKTKEGIGA